MRWTEDDAYYRAFRWDTNSADMLDLGSLRADNLGYSSASALSADGSVVVGAAETDDGVLRAFIWRTQMQDFENLILSFPLLANDTAISVAEQQFALGQVMQHNGMASRAGQGVLFANTATRHTGRNPPTVGARATSLVALGYGYGISDTMTLGASISASGTSLDDNAFDMDTGVGAAIWGEYSAGGANLRTGLRFTGALGYTRNEGEVARGRLMTNTMLATGNATVETRALRAALGYGFQQGLWLVTPNLGVAHYETTRAAYTETGADFNASHDALRASRTVATLGLTGEFAVDEQGSLLPGAGVDHEVNPVRMRLTGTSDIPGLAIFDFASSLTPNRTRPFAVIGYSHHIGNHATLSGNLRVAKAVFGTTPAVGMSLDCSIRFRGCHAQRVMVVGPRPPHGSSCGQSWHFDTELLHSGVLRNEGPLPLRLQAARSTSAVPSALKRFMMASRI